MVPSVVPYGVEVDPARLAHVRDLLPEFVSNFYVGDMFAVPEIWTLNVRYTLAIVMPGRLLEADEQGRSELAARFRERLRDHCDQVLVFAYGDWLARHGSLQGPSRKVGLVVADRRPALTAGLVASVE
jgi:hypothetical protein